MSTGMRRCRMSAKLIWIGWQIEILVMPLKWRKYQNHDTRYAIGISHCSPAPASRYSIDAIRGLHQNRKFMSERERNGCLPSGWQLMSLIRRPDSGRFCRLALFARRCFLLAHRMLTRTHNISHNMKHAANIDFAALYINKNERTRMKGMILSVERAKKCGGLRFKSI